MVPARYINNHLCTILILNKIEDAYTLIRRYKRQGMQGNIDIHPYSSMFKKPRSFVSSLGLDINHKKSRIFIEPESPNKKFKPNESPVSSDFGELELKTTGGSMEDGEIIGEDEDVRDQDYQLFEYPGVYWMKDITELSHSGVMVKTSLARDGSL